MSKTVLITGGSRGIGRACVRLFAEKGWQVAFCYRSREEEANALAAELPGVLAVRADVTDRADVRRLISLTEHRFGRIDALVCNAGVAQQKLFTDLTDEDWRQMFAVHVDGAFHCCQGVLPKMIAQGGGSIVCVSSMWGETGGACEVHYSAAKAALIGMVRALAKETGLSGIRVNCVAPGVIDTDMNAALDDDTMDALAGSTPLHRIGRPEEAAAAICFLCSEEASFITGQVLSPNGGLVIG